jgi:single-strand DNA-binding protein
MSGLNKLMIIGRAGKDGELRYDANGKPQLRFSVAVDGWGKPPKTTWFNCILFGDRAERLAQYVVKGAQLYVEGRHESRDWEKDGTKHTSWDVVTSDIQLLGGAPAGTAPRQAAQEDFDADELPFD